MKRQRKEKRIQTEGPAVKPVKVPVILAWLQKLREETEDPDQLAIIEETMDIITDYEAAKGIQSLAAEVLRINARTLRCGSCGAKVIPGDVCCGGCGKKLIWNLRGGTK